MSEQPQPTPPEGAPKPTPPSETPSGAKDGPEQYPADHPLVKALAAQKDEIKALKDRTRRLDELEQAQMTEAEKAAQRLAAAEAEVAAVPGKVTEALKSHLVSIHEISDDDAELFLTATSPDLLLKQVSRLVETKGAGRKQNIVPREGTNPRPADDKDAVARAFFGIS